MKNDKNHDVNELFRLENARVFTYLFIYAVLLAIYIHVLREIPFSPVLPILVILFMHFFYIKYGTKNEITPLYNYSPIWSSVSIFFFVLIFISEIFIGKENVALVIGMFGAIVLTIIYLVTVFVISQDVGM